MKNPRSLNVRRYEARFIDMNEYLASFPGENTSDKICVTKIFFKSMHNSWSMHVHVQGFDCESIFFKKTVNMFKSMEIAEIIYEGVVAYSLKNLPLYMDVLTLEKVQKSFKTSEFY